MARKKDIEKYCKNCGLILQRKHWSGRIEANHVFKKREFCDRACYTEFRRKNIETPDLPTETPKQLRDRVKKDIEDNTSPEEIIEGLQPLEFMLREMNRVSNSKAYRKEMAALAAPYVHTRMDGANAKQGKKEERATKATEAVSRFGQTQAPKVAGRIGN